MVIAYHLILDCFTQCPPFWTFSCWNHQSSLNKKHEEQPCGIFESWRSLCKLSAIQKCSMNIRLSNFKSSSSATSNKIQCQSVIFFSKWLLHEVIFVQGNVIVLRNHFELEVLNKYCSPGLVEYTHLPNIYAGLWGFLLFILEIFPNRLRNNACWFLSFSLLLWNVFFPLKYSLCSISLMLLASAAVVLVLKIRHE